MAPRAESRTRRGVTLLEVVLAMGLLALLTTMTYWFYSSSLASRRQGTDESHKLRLVRVTLERIATEIRQASSVITDDRVGIRGEAERIWLSTARLPGRELVKERSLREGPPPAEYDLVKVEYKIVRHPDIKHDDGYEYPLGLARVEIPVPRADSAQTGSAFEDERIDALGGRQNEARLEAFLDEAFFGELESGDEVSLEPEIEWEQLYAPEILFLRFCYYDGNKWWDTWDVTGENPLPQLVQVTIGFEIQPPFEEEFMTREVEEFCTCLNEDPVECEPLPPDQYSTIVRVSQADPLFRSRIGRETQAFMEQLSRPEQEGEREAEEGEAP